MTVTTGNGDIPTLTKPDAARKWVSISISVLSKEKLFVLLLVMKSCKVMLRIGFINLLPARKTDLVIPSKSTLEAQQERRDSGPLQLDSLTRKL